MSVIPVPQDQDVKTRVFAAVQERKWPGAKSDRHDDVRVHQRIILSGWASIGLLPKAAVALTNTQVETAAAQSSGQWVGCVRQVNVYLARPQSSRMRRKWRGVLPGRRVAHLGIQFACNVAAYRRLVDYAAWQVPAS